jgi:hypothetical protein
MAGRDVCVCFTPEILFLIFNTVALLVSSKAFTQLNFSLLWHLPHLPQNSSQERCCFMNGGKNNPEYLKL